MNRHKNIFCNKRGCTSTCYPWWINLYTYVLNHYLLAAPYHLNYRHICSLWVFFMTLKCILLVCMLSACVKRWPTFSSIFWHKRYILINDRGHQAFWQVFNVVNPWWIIYIHVYWPILLWRHIALITYIFVPYGSFSWHWSACMTSNMYNKRVLSCILRGRFMAENRMFLRINWTRQRVNILIQISLIFVPTATIQFMKRCELFRWWLDPDMVQMA